MTEEQVTPAVDNLSEDALFELMLDIADGGDGSEIINIKETDGKMSVEDTETETEDDSTEDSIQDSEDEVAPITEDTEDDLEESEEESEDVSTHEESDSKDTDGEETEEEAEEVQEETSNEADEDEVTVTTDSESNLDVDELNKLREFHNKVTRKFKANGKEFDGFDDPDLIIKAQQKALGYDKLAQRMSKFKPIEKALETSGLLEDEGKFNFMMELLNGNPEAIKQHLKSLEIDPYDLDLEDIDEKKLDVSHTESDISLAFDEVINLAESKGIQKEVESKVFDSWDNTSIAELLSSSEDRDNLLEHIETGLYDRVENELRELKRRDVAELRGKSSLDQYSIASRIYLDKLKRENEVKNTETKQEEVKPQKSVVKPQKSVKSVVSKAKKASKGTVKRTTVTPKKVAKDSTEYVDSLNEEELFSYMMKLAED